MSTLAAERNRPDNRVVRVSFTAPEPLLPLAAKFDALVKLSEAGITAKWEGPPEWQGRAIGGRAYQRRP